MDNFRDQSQRLKRARAKLLQQQQRGKVAKFTLVGNAQNLQARPVVRHMPHDRPVAFRRNHEAVQVELIHLRSHCYRPAL